MLVLVVLLASIVSVVGFVVLVLALVDHGRDADLLGAELMDSMEGGRGALPLI